MKKVVVVNSDPVEKITLPKEQVSEICSEIETQWLYLVMARAVFRADFPEKDNYESPEFYQRHEIVFSIKLPEKKSKNFLLAAKGIKLWLNQNYVIRLYGTLEKYRILYSGRKAYGNKVMILLYELRPKIGAHSAGCPPSDKEGRKHLIKATKLTNELFKRDREFLPGDVKHYDLPLDSVLQPMKDQAIEFVRSLEAK